MSFFARRNCLRRLGGPSWLKMNSMRSVLSAQLAKRDIFSVKENVGYELTQPRDALTAAELLMEDLTHR